MRGADERAFTEYVGERMPTLRRVAYLLCGDSHRADDLVQVTITKLYTHWRRASGMANLDAYVRAMLVKTFLSEQRLGWMRRIRLVGAPADAPVVPAPEGPDVETRTVLRAALRRVPPKARAVLVLRFLLDLPVAEVAELLGCSEGNVKSQTSSGLRTLRQLLGGSQLSLAGRER